MSLFTAFIQSLSIVESKESNPDESNTKELNSTQPTKESNTKELNSTQPTKESNTKESNTKESNTMELNSTQPIKETNTMESNTTQQSTQPTMESNTTQKTNALTFETIKQALENKGLTVKCWKDLFIVHYKKHTETSDPFIKECRGLIVNKKAPFNIVCKGFDMFETFESIDKMQLVNANIPYKITQTVDGTYIRMYYYEGKWCIATNRCIDAKKARWQSYKTFYDYFQEAAQLYLLNKNNLKTHCTYLFVLCHPENRIVVPHVRIELYHVGTIDNQTFEEIEHDIGIKTPVVVDSPLETVCDLSNLSQLDWKHPGYVVVWENSSTTSPSNHSKKRYKIRNPKFEYVNQLRGNSLNITEHYLTLRSEQPQRFIEFCKYFPEYSTIEDSLNMVARYVHGLYIAYYVSKTIEYVPDRISWRILSELHRRYIRTKEPTSLDIVQNFIRSMPNAELAQLLRF